MTIFGNDKEGKMYLKAARKQTREKLKTLTEVIFEAALKRKRKGERIKWMKD